MPDEKRLFQPHSVKNLVAGWLVHAHKSRDRHDQASRSYARWQYLLGIPALILSTVVGTSLFSAYSSSQVPSWWVGLLSMTAAILTALQTFMDYGGRSDKHRLAGVKYKEAIRALEYLSVKLANGEQLTDEQISAVKAQLDALEEAAPVVMPNVYDRVEARYQNAKYVHEALELYKT
jgi:hypothetical protein